MWSPVSIFVLVKVAVVKLVARILGMKCHCEVFVRCSRVRSWVSRVSDLAV